VNQTGQSDHPGQGNYADQLDAWMHGRTFGWAFGEQAIAEATRQTLVLKPGK
jgi:penicillin amidase